jgi:formate hydrogenlyase subunit 3/multisubunit Na+/H+ antiporter MnhD subunit
MVPVLVLVAGAFGLLVGMHPRFRFAGLVGVLTALFAFLALVLMGLRPLPATNIVSNWRPEALFAAPLTFRVDPLAWLAGLAIAVITLSVFLTGLARGGGRRLGARAATLMIAAAALSAVFSADLVTLAVAWGALDLLYFLVLVGLADTDERQAVLSLALNAAATLLVVAGAVRLTTLGQSTDFTQAAPPARAALLLALAAVFRLGLFPLHVGLPLEVNLRQGLSTLLRLAPAAVALMLLARLLSGEGIAVLRPWLTVAGVAALWVGAAQWWIAAEPRQGLPFLVVSQSGVVLLTGLWGGPAALAGLAAQGLALLLGGAVLFLYRGFEERAPWQAALPGLAAAALAGAPFLTGFTGHWALYTGLIAQGNFLVLLLALAGQALLGAGLLRLCFARAEPAAGPEVDLPVVRAAYLAGLGLPVVFLLLAGLSPGGLAGFLGAGGVPGFAGLFDLNGLVAIALIVLAALASLALWRYEGELRARTETTWAALAAATRPDWLYLGAWQAVRAAGVVLGMASALLDGAGAVLWAVLIGLVLWVSFTGGVR